MLRRPARVVLVLLAMASALGVVGAAPAGATTKAPGLLQAKDIPGTFVQSGDIAKFPTLSTAAVDAATCSETPKSVDGGLGAVTIAFARTTSVPLNPTFYEYVLSFPSAKSAKVAFAALSAGADAAVKCGTLNFVPPTLAGGTAAAPTSTVTVSSVKLPKVGSGVFGLVNGTPGPTASVSVTLVSGPYIVFMGRFGTDGPSVKDFSKILPRVVKRLPIPTEIPAPTTTTAPKPLVVDPATSGCAQEGTVKSAGSQPANLTFVNHTTQTLRIYWIDFTGIRKPYGEVAPGASTNQGTSVGHVWILADTTDRCVRLATVDTATFTMTVTS